MIHETLDTLKGSVPCFNLLIERDAEVRCGEMKIGGLELTPIQIAALCGRRDILMSLYRSEAETKSSDLLFAKNRQIRMFMKYYGNDYNNM